MQNANSNARERDRAIELIRNTAPRHPGRTRRDGTSIEMRLTKKEAGAILDTLLAPPGPGRLIPGPLYTRCSCDQY